LHVVALGVIEGDEAGYPRVGYLRFGWVDDKPCESLDLLVQIVDPECD